MVPLEVSMQEKRATITLTVAAIIFGFFCVPRVFAQAPPPASLYTAEMVNGRFWKSLDEPGKLFLLRGAADAIQFLIVELGGVQQILDSAGVEKVNREYAPLQVTFGEILQQIDAFYVDGANANIPVVYARQYAIRKMNGSSPKELEGYASAIRLLFSRWIEKNSPQK
jgi:hypothetical protein